MISGGCWSCQSGRLPHIPGPELLGHHERVPPEWKGRAAHGRYAKGPLGRWRLNRRWRAKRRAVSCSFCGKPQADVAKVIAGPCGVYICNECIALCNDILAENLAPPPSERPLPAD
ncbi:MAG TPA: hypothetical protein DCQ30_02960 [Acidimicrobiaceae bacterium]|nr:hypothetical protein [Acidimicrobiaceae bacterium]